MSHSNILVSNNDGIVSIEGSSRDKKNGRVKRVADAERTHGAKT